MQVYSLSQKKLIEVPDTEASSTTQAPTGEMGSDSFKKAALMDLLTTGGKNLTKLKAAQDIIQPAPSETEKKAVTAKGNADRILAQLEDLYYGEAGTKGDLAKGRLGGITSTLGATLGINAKLKTYKDLLVSIRPTLAKAAGDAGNLALQEQIMAGKVIPTTFSTPEEAAMKFKSVRARFGLPERDLTSVQGPALNQAQLTFPKLIQLLSTAKNIPQMLRKTGEEVVQKGPFAAPSPELRKLGGGSGVETGNRFINAATDAYKQSITSQGAAAEVATPALILSSLLSGGKAVLGKLNPAKQIAEGVAAREAGATGASVAGKVIDGKVVTDRVIKELGGETLNKVPQAARAKVKVLLGEFMKDFKGKIDPRKALERLQATTAGGTFTQSGSISAKAAAGFEAAVNRALKSVFADVAPDVLKGQAQIAAGETMKKIVNPVNISRGVVGGVATAGALGAGYGLMRLLGIGGNQGGGYGQGQ